MFPPSTAPPPKYINAMQLGKTRIFISEMFSYPFVSCKKVYGPKAEASLLGSTTYKLMMIKWNILGKDGLFFTFVYSLILNKLNCIISKLES